MNDNPEIEKIDFSNGDFMLFYLEQNWKGLVFEIFRMAGSVGVPITKSLSKSLSNLSKQVKDQASKLKANSDFHYLLQFAEENSEKKGSIYEFNQVSQIIYSLVKGRNSSKEIVLMIDDLDRVDPAHIFRILNVLSAHVDFDGQQNNKFGFDKIILVCDLSNIRKIFKKFYGLETDFSGYIDKFISTYIYHYNIKAIIKDNLLGYIENLKLSGPVNYSYLFSNNPLFYSGLIEVISTFITYNQLNLRKLIQFNQTDLALPEIKTGGKNGVDFQRDLILIFFQILEVLVGGESELTEAIEKVSRNISRVQMATHNTYGVLMEKILFLYERKENKEFSTFPGDYIYQLDEERLNMLYDVDFGFQSGSESIIKQYVTKGSDGKEEFFETISKDIDFWKYFFLAYKNYRALSRDFFTQ